MAQYCASDPGWSANWSRTFQRLRWTQAQNPPSLTLMHFYSCVYNGSLAPLYFGLMDWISLSESNVVYSFNGRLVRSGADVSDAHHETITIEDDQSDRTGERMTKFLSDNIQDYLTDLVLGNNGDTSPLPSAPPVTAVAPAPPVTAAAPTTTSQVTVIVEDALFGSRPVSRPRASGQFEWLVMCLSPGSSPSLGDPRTQAFQEAIRQFLLNHDFGYLPASHAYINIASSAGKFAVSQVGKCGQGDEIDFQAARFRDRAPEPPAGPDLLAPVLTKAVGEEVALALLSARASTGVANGGNCDRSPGPRGPASLGTGKRRRFDRSLGRCIRRLSDRRRTGAAGYEHVEVEYQTAAGPELLGHPER
jgi:hypothetical protein